MKKGCLFATNLISPENYNLKLGKRSSSFALICSEKRRKILKSSLFCLFFVCFVCLFFFCFALLLLAAFTTCEIILTRQGGAFLCLLVFC